MGTIDDGGRRFRKARSAVDGDCRVWSARDSVEQVIEDLDKREGLDEGEEVDGLILLERILGTDEEGEYTRHRGTYQGLKRTEVVDLLLRELLLAVAER